ncbi:MAG: hypothetical protein QXU30_07045 [Sulfolobales archaeon]
MSRVGLSGSIGFFGFLLRMVLSVIVVWILTIFISVILVMTYGVTVDVMKSFIQPITIVDTVGLGIGLLILSISWLVSMFLVYVLFWKGRSLR